MSEAIDILVDRIKTNVSDLASRTFLHLTNSPNLYKGIEITDDYELRIVTKGGITRPVWEQMPSSGQSEIIATSFISALNRYTAREAPVIIDTPMGRLDPTHKDNLVQFYPDIGPQVIVLYQPSELSQKDIELIAKSIMLEYRLVRDSQNVDNTVIAKAG
jgi:DNA sulfur modification protein DndD